VLEGQSKRQNENIFSFCLFSEGLNNLVRDKAQLEMIAFK